MRLSFLAGLALTGAVHAQQTPVVLPASFAPELNELDSRTPYPTSTDETRTQVFYDSNEVSPTPFTAFGLALRYDGPLTPTAGGGQLFDMTRFVVRGGVTDVAQPGSDFEANLTRPLVTLYDGPLQFVLDQRAVGGPEPWEPTLTIRFAQPLSYDPLNGSFLVFEFLTEGNLAAGAGHGSLDAATVGGGISGGFSARSGSGCGITTTAPPARIDVVGARPFSGSYGTFAPGSAYSLWASSLAPSQPVVVLGSLSGTVGPGGVALPFQVPGTACDVLTGSEFSRATMSDAFGTVLPFGDATGVAVPPDNVFRGMSLFHQFAGIAPGANPLGVVTTDRLEIGLGDFQPPQRGLWMAANRNSRTGRFATDVLPMALAIRLDRQ